MWGYFASLALLAFMQAPGRIVADTKIDMPLAPWQFLGRATHLWDGLSSFGQLQNQAYGYLWPMGPFFGLAEMVAMPPWITQRLWWTLLLALAFFGVVKLAQALGIGTPGAQVAAAYAFVLTPRVATLLGASSIELWPTALMPWVLLVLVRGTQGGSVVRAGALAGLLVACAGGVNATAVSALLPLGVIWIATRARGPRRWRLLVWWGFFTVVCTLWWLVPLVLLGRYSAPFLDYIETAAVTTSATGSLPTLLGTSNWVAYLDPVTYAAGNSFLTTAYLILNTALLAGLGLVGIVMRGSEHRRFMVYGLLTGMVLVGLGYAGVMSGWGAQSRQDLLDGVLSPLRNAHKYDGVLRLVLVLGLARVIAEVPRHLAAVVGRVGVLSGRAILAVVLVGLVTPWTSLQVATASTQEVPHYWTEVAAHLEENSSGGTALLLPAATFGTYVWGSTRDDVLQPLARSPWATRNVIPLAQPGNVLLLDGITRIIEGGAGTEELAPLLRSAGVDQVVLRNDLDRARLDGPDPARVRAVLSGSPGLALDAGFGPWGGGGLERDAEGNRVFLNEGPAAAYQAVEVFRVVDPVPRASLVGADAIATVVGSPESAAGTLGTTRMFPSDAAPQDLRRVVLTDSLRRREEAFQAVRWNSSATMAADAGFLLRRPEAFHRISAEDERWQSTEEWQGVAGVGASSSQADVRASTPLIRSTHPGAALDADEGTAWRPAYTSDAEGAWWQVELRAPTDLARVRVRLADDSIELDQIRFSAGDAAEVVDAPAPGEARTYELNFAATESLRLTALEVTPRFGATLGVAEVEIEGVRPERFIALPQAPAGGQVRAVALRRDAGRNSCVDLDGTYTCTAEVSIAGEDGDELKRVLHLEAPLSLEVAMKASLRQNQSAIDALAHSLGVSVVAPSLRKEPGHSALAMIDGDEGTTWLGSAANASFEVTLAERVRLRTLHFRLDPDAVAARPRIVRVSAGGSSAVRVVGSDGAITLPGWPTDRIRVEVVKAEPVAQAYGDERRFVPTGVSEVRVNSDTFDTTIDVGCGRGPRLKVGSQTIQTRVRTSLAQLLRAQSVQLSACGPVASGTSPRDVVLPSGRTRVVAEPTPLLRVDAVDLNDGEDVSASGPAPTNLELRTHGVDSPASTFIHEADPRERLLVLGQNFNVGWTAHLAGAELEPVRVNGWQQAWRVPARASGEVRFTYGPAGAYRLALGLGAVAVVAVAVGLVLTVRRRQRGSGLPPLTAAPVGWVDVVLMSGALGLLGGWLAVGAGAVGLLVMRRRPGLEIGGPVAAAVLLGALPRVVEQWRAQDWAAWAGQLCALIAVACVVAALLAELRAPAQLRRTRQR